jgi:hypothetical protein
VVEVALTDAIAIDVSVPLVVIWDLAELGVAAAVECELIPLAVAIAAGVLTSSCRPPLVEAWGVPLELATSISGVAALQKSRTGS